MGLTASLYNGYRASVEAALRLWRRRVAPALYSRVFKRSYTPPSVECTRRMVDGPVPLGWLLDLVPERAMHCFFGRSGRVIVEVCRGPPGALEGPGACVCMNSDEPYPESGKPCRAREMLVRTKNGDALVRVVEV